MNINPWKTAALVARSRATTTLDSYPRVAIAVCDFEGLSWYAVTELSTIPKKNATELIFSPSPTYWFSFPTRSVVFCIAPFSPHSRRLSVCIATVALFGSIVSDDVWFRFFLEKRWGSSHQIDFERKTRMSTVGVFRDDPRCDEN